MPLLFNNRQPMCYEQLLGLKECDKPEPTTGLYINDLGINQTLLGQLITDQYNSGVELFEAKRAFAWRKMSSDILSRLTPMMKADTIVDGKRIGQVLTNNSNVQTALGANKYGGIRVKIDPNSLSFLNLYISDIYLAIDAANINVNILVFDMTTLKLIDTIVYAEGSLEQFLGKTFAAKRRKLDLAFVYESTMNAAKYIAKKGHCYDCGGSVREAHICPFVDAIGIELTTNGTDVLTSKTSKFTTGMSMNYNVNCDRVSWLCSIGGLMAMPLAYATAVEIYDYSLTISPTIRVNTPVSVANENIVEARNIAATRYNEELAAMLQNMRLPDDNTCFDCRRNMKYVTALP